MAEKNKRRTSDNIPDICPKDNKKTGVGVVSVPHLLEN